MAEKSSAPELLVIEYSGPPRSGKGTVVEDLVHSYPHVAKDETGFYYRLLTRQFLDSGAINQNMNTGEVLQVLQGKSVKQLTGMLSEASQWATAKKRQALYQNDVNKIVPDVGQLHSAREAVKGGFAARIKDLVKDEQYRVVAIDGRNLSEVVEKIAGARMLLRVFMDCSPYEATLRECTRDGVDPADAQGQEVLNLIQQRTQKDASRQEDAVVVDKDAIDYWQGTGVGAVLNKLRGAASMDEYLRLVAKHENSFDESLLPRNIGWLAALSGRQIEFDTTAFRLFADPKNIMRAAARQMFAEALSSA